MSAGTASIMEPESIRPEILAPAGDEDCFLAALAAGADAIYLGLKQFSARMEAENFHMEQLSRLIDLAHASDCRVYVAMNSIIKPNELTLAYRLCKRLATQAKADGLIIQDLALPDLARQAGFEGMIAFSTLANVSSPLALRTAQKMGANRVIIPRELSIDEIRNMGENCPSGLGLECFVHGALCYCVSGRCYWSSYMGGKSGLRGRCVQPCRRLYSRQPQNGKPGQPERNFSCQDLELGVLTKTLLSVPNLVSWKIEGRKKGPHYVYHTVTAYRLLRDSPQDPQIRKMALEILEMALGRPGVKARFLPQREQPPMGPGKQTGSGLLAGKIIRAANGQPAIKTRLELKPGDYLRIGSEDESWHTTLPVRRAVPKAAEMTIKLPAHKTPRIGAPVILIDRREPELLQLLHVWQHKLKKIPLPAFAEVSGQPSLPRPITKRPLLPDMLVRRESRPGCAKNTLNGIWLGQRPVKISHSQALKTCFWLPPVIWPDQEDCFAANVNLLWHAGARHFVLNAPWQRAYFPEHLPGNARLIAGPFCNLANSLAMEALAREGFSAAFASPELTAADYETLPAHSPLALGLVISGFWPVGISRFGLAGINVNEIFQSPKGERFWSKNFGGNYWIFPAWKLDLEQKRDELLKMGYSFFALLEESPPPLPAKARPGLFNWDNHLL